MCVAAVCVWVYVLVCATLDVCYRVKNYIEYTSHTTP